MRIDYDSFGGDALKFGGTQDRRRLQEVERIMQHYRGSAPAAWTSFPLVDRRGPRPLVFS